MSAWSLRFVVVVVVSVEAGLGGVGLSRGSRLELEGALAGWIPMGLPKRDVVGVGRVVSAWPGPGGGGAPVGWELGSGVVIVDSDCVGDCG